MPALGRLPADQATATVQQIKTKAINPWFMSALFGTAVISVVAIIVALADIGDDF
jgi:uncharacterized membrane protein